MSIFLLLLAACSGGIPKPTSDSGADRDADDGEDRPGDSGTKNGGSGKEGAACSEHVDCRSDLRCLKADAHDQELKICARPCDEDKQCRSEERCRTATGEPSEALCWSTVSEVQKFGDSTPSGAYWAAQVESMTESNEARVYKLGELDAGRYKGGTTVSIYQNARVRCVSSEKR